MSRLATACLSVALLCGLAAATLRDDPPPDSIGSIDGVAIPRAEFERWLVDVFGPPNVGSFLEQRAIAAGAQKLGFAPSAERVEAAVEEEWNFVTRERFGNDEAAYVKELANVGHSKASFRLARSRAIATDLAIEACARAARATDDAALTNRLTEFYGNPPVRRVVRAILVDRRRDHPEDARPDVSDIRERRTAEAMTRAQRALARLEAGDAFADVARAFSDHESAVRGGLLEPYRATTFGGSVDATIAAFRSAGERSAILETRVGYVIVELVRVEDATMPTVRDELKRLVLDESIMPDERETARRTLLAQVELVAPTPR